MKKAAKPTKSNDPDSRLLRQARRGRLAAFDELVRRHQGSVLNFCALMLDNAAVAEKLSVDYFALAYQLLHEPMAGHSFQTWLFKLIYGQSLTLPPLAATTAPGPTVVPKVLGQLPPDQRAVVILRDVLGWPEERIAPIFDVTAGTVHTRLHAARMHLRGALRDAGLLGEAVS